MSTPTVAAASRPAIAAPAPGTYGDDQAAPQPHFRRLPRPQPLHQVLALMASTFPSLTTARISTSQRTPARAVMASTSRSLTMA